MDNEESSTEKEADDSIDEYFRCVPAADGWVFQVGLVEWDSPHTPHIAWKDFRRWKREPDAKRKEQAKTAAIQRWFRTCSHCHQLTNPGHMHDRSLCQGCAMDELGVVY